MPKKAKRTIANNITVDEARGHVWIDGEFFPYWLGEGYEILYEDDEGDSLAHLTITILADHLYTVER